MRIAPLVATAIAFLSGCYTHHQVWRIRPGQEVSIEFAKGGRDISVTTSNNAKMVVPQVRQLAGRVLQIRRDSAEVRIHEVKPANQAVVNSTIMLALPGAGSGPEERWKASEFSGKRTAALILGPPAAALLLLMILIAAASGGGLPPG